MWTFILSFFQESIILSIITYGHLSSLIPDILLLGILGDRDTLAIGFQLVLDNFSVGIVLYTEGVVQDTGDVIVP